MTIDELTAVKERLQAAADLAESEMTARKAAEARLVDAARAEAVADKLVGLGVFPAAYRKEAAAAFANLASTLDFVENLAEDRTKLAARIDDNSELHPGHSVKKNEKAASSTGPSAEDELDLKFSRLRSRVQGAGR